jgi:hypothetical protein
MQFGVTEYRDALRNLMNIELRTISEDIVRAHTNH